MSFLINFLFLSGQYIKNVAKRTYRSVISSQPSSGQCSQDADLDKMLFVSDEQWPQNEKREKANVLAVVGLHNKNDVDKFCTVIERALKKPDNLLIEDQTYLDIRFVESEWGQGLNAVHEYLSKTSIENTMLVSNNHRSSNSPINNSTSRSLSNEIEHPAPETTLDVRHPQQIHRLSDEKLLTSLLFFLHEMETFKVTSHILNNCSQKYNTQNLRQPTEKPKRTDETVGCSYFKDLRATLIAIHNNFELNSYCTNLQMNPPKNRNSKTPNDDTVRRFKNVQVKLYTIKMLVHRHKRHKYERLLRITKEMCLLTLNKTQLVTDNINSMQFSQDFKKHSLIPELTPAKRPHGVDLDEVLNATQVLYANEIAFNRLERQMFLKLLSENAAAMIRKQAKPKPVAAPKTFPNEVKQVRKITLADIKKCEIVINALEADAIKAVARLRKSRDPVMKQAEESLMKTKDTFVRHFSDASEREKLLKVTSEAFKAFENSLKTVKILSKPPDSVIEPQKTFEERFLALVDSVKEIALLLEVNKKAFHNLENKIFVLETMNKIGGTRDSLKALRSNLERFFDAQMLPSNIMLNLIEFPTAGTSPSYMNNKQLQHEIAARTVTDGNKQNYSINYQFSISEDKYRDLCGVSKDEKKVEQAEQKLKFPNYHLELHGHNILAPFRKCERQPPDDPEEELIIEVIELPAENKVKNPHDTVVPHKTTEVQMLIVTKENRTKTNAILKYNLHTREETKPEPYVNIYPNDPRSSTEDPKVFEAKAVQNYLKFKSRVPDLEAQNWPVSFALLGTTDPTVTALKEIEEKSLPPVQRDFVSVGSRLRKYDASSSASTENLKVVEIPDVRTAQSEEQAVETRKAINMVIPDDEMSVEEEEVVPKKKPDSTKDFMNASEDVSTVEDTVEDRTASVLLDDKCRVHFGRNPKPVDNLPLNVEAINLIKPAEEPMQFKNLLVIDENKKEDTAVMILEAVSDRRRLALIPLPIPLLHPKSGVEMEYKNLQNAPITKLFESAPQVTSDDKIKPPDKHLEEPIAKAETTTVLPLADSAKEKPKDAPQDVVISLINVPKDLAEIKDLKAINLEKIRATEGVVKCELSEDGFRVNVTMMPPGVNDAMAEKMEVKSVEVEVPKVCEGTWVDKVEPKVWVGGVASKVINLDAVDKDAVKGEKGVVKSEAPKLMNLDNLRKEVVGVNDVPKAAEKAVFKSEAPKLINLENLRKEIVGVNGVPKAEATKEAPKQEVVGVTSVKIAPKAEVKTEAPKLLNLENLRKEVEKIKGEIVQAKAVVTNVAETKKAKSKTEIKADKAPKLMNLDALKKEIVRMMNQTIDPTTDSQKPPNRVNLLTLAREIASRAYRYPQSAIVAKSPPKTPDSKFRTSSQVLQPKGKDNSVMRALEAELREREEEAIRRKNALNLEQQTAKKLEAELQERNKLSAQPETVVKPPVVEENPEKVLQVIQEKIKEVQREKEATAEEVLLKKDEVVEKPSEPTQELVHKEAVVVDSLASIVAKEILGPVKEKQIEAIKAIEKEERIASPKKESVVAEQKTATVAPVVKQETPTTPKVVVMDETKKIGIVQQKVVETVKAIEPVKPEQTKVVSAPDQPKIRNEKDGMALKTPEEQKAALSASDMNVATEALEKMKPRLTASKISPVEIFQKKRDEQKDLARIDDNVRTERFEEIKKLTPSVVETKRVDVQEQKPKIAKTSEESKPPPTGEKTNLLRRVQMQPVDVDKLEAQRPKDNAPSSSTQAVSKGQVIAKPAPCEEKAQAKTEEVKTSEAKILPYKDRTKVVKDKLVFIEKQQISDTPRKKFVDVMAGEKPPKGSPTVNLLKTAPTPSAKPTGNLAEDTNDTKAPANLLKSVSKLDDPKTLKTISSKQAAKAETKEDASKVNIKQTLVDGKKETTSLKKKTDESKEKTVTLAETKKESESVKKAAKAETKEDAPKVNIKQTHVDDKKETASLKKKTDDSKEKTVTLAETKKENQSVKKAAKAETKEDAPKVNILQTLVDDKKETASLKKKTDDSKEKTVTLAETKKESQSVKKAAKAETKGDAPKVNILQTLVDDKKESASLKKKTDDSKEQTVTLVETKKESQSVKKPSITSTAKSPVDLSVKSAREELKKVIVKSTTQLKQAPTLDRSLTKEEIEKVDLRPRTIDSDTAAKKPSVLSAESLGKLPEDQPKEATMPQPKESLKRSLIPSPKPVVKASSEEVEKHPKHPIQKKPSAVTAKPVVKPPPVAKTEKVAPKTTLEVTKELKKALGKTTLVVKEDTKIAAEGAKVKQQPAVVKKTSTVSAKSIAKLSPDEAKEGQSANDKQSKSSAKVTQITSSKPLKPVVASGKTKDEVNQKPTSICDVLEEPLPKPPVEVNKSIASSAKTSPKLASDESVDKKELETAKLAETKTEFTQQSAQTFIEKLKKTAITASSNSEASPEESGEKLEEKPSGDVTESTESPSKLKKPSSPFSDRPSSKFPTTDGKKELHSQPQDLKKATPKLDPRRSGRKFNLEVAVKMLSEEIKQDNYLPANQKMLNEIRKSSIYPNKLATKVKEEDEKLRLTETKTNPVTVAVVEKLVPKVISEAKEDTDNSVKKLKLAAEKSFTLSGAKGKLSTAEIEIVETTLVTPTSSKKKEKPKEDLSTLSAGRVKLNEPPQVKQQEPQPDEEVVEKSIIIEDTFGQQPLQTLPSDKEKTEAATTIKVEKATVRLEKPGPAQEKRLELTEQKTAAAEVEPETQRADEAKKLEKSKKKAQKWCTHILNEKPKHLKAKHVEYVLPKKSMWDQNPRIPQNVVVLQERMMKEREKPNSRSAKPKKYKYETKETKLGTVTYLVEEK